MSFGVDVGSWWLERVQKIKRKLGNKWELYKNPINFMSQTTANKKVSSTSSIKIMLNWFKRKPSRNKFKYEVTIIQWIDINNVHCTIALSFNSKTNVYILKENNKDVLDEFVSKNP